MSGELRLERLPSERPEQAACVLCDEFFEPGGTLVILYDGHLPLGYLCPACAADPRVAAHRVRLRAHRILSLLSGEMGEVRKESTVRRLQLIYRRAAYWKNVADRIEQLGSWE